MLSNEQNKIREEVKSLDDVSAKVCVTYYWKFCLFKYYIQILIILIHVFSKIQLEKSFEANDAIMNRNVDAVDARVTDLAGRLDKLMVHWRPKYYRQLLS